MVSPEGPKSEAGRAEIGRVLGEGKFPSSPARGTGERCKLPMGSGAKPERYGDLKAAPGVDFADTKFISMKFSCGLSHRIPHNQILVGVTGVLNTGPPPHRRLWVLCFGRGKCVVQ